MEIVEKVQRRKSVERERERGKMNVSEIYETTNEEIKLAWYFDIVEIPRDKTGDLPSGVSRLNYRIANLTFPVFSNGNIIEKNKTER